MSLRARILVALTVLFAAVVATLGFAAVRATQQALTNQLDDKLHGAVAMQNVLGGNGGASLPMPTESRIPGGRTIATVVYAPDGSIRRAEPAGTIESPLALPLVDLSVPLEFGQPFTTASADGTVTYRALVARDRSGGTVVVAADMSGVDIASRWVASTVALGSVLALGVFVLVGGALLRRALKPVEKMVATADRIGRVDFSARIEPAGSASEVAVLAASLNRMLDRMEATVTERDAARAELEQFLADAAHELRTPITTLKGYAELLDTPGFADPAEVQAATSRIKRESARMGRLVDGLLALARIEGRSREEPIVEQSVVLSEVVLDAVNDLRALEPDRPLTLDVDAAIEVRGYADQLRQVVANLLANVRMHTPSRSALDVSLRQHSQEVRLRIHDCGPGIAALDLPNVTHRFYRSTDTTAQSGSGLGLAIVDSIVRGHGGQFAIESEVGAGTLVTVTLPCVARDVTPAPALASQG